MAGREPVEQQPSGDFVDGIVKASKVVTGEAKQISEEEVIGTVEDTTKERRIMTTQPGVKLYSRPSLSADAVIGMMPPNMSFAIKGRTNNPFGEWYKLQDGRFVSTGDAVKEI